DDGSRELSVLLVFGMTFDAFLFCYDPATPEIYTLSLHDALPISGRIILTRNSAALRVSHLDTTARAPASYVRPRSVSDRVSRPRSEEHTSELQSPCNLVCRLLLEKKK